MAVISTTTCSQQETKESDDIVSILEKMLRHSFVYSNVLKVVSNCVFLIAWKSKLPEDKIGVIGIWLIDLITKLTNFIN